jgi:hypothetical protein
MIRLSMLHHHANNQSSIHLLILVNINLLLCLKLLQLYSSILYHLKLMFLFHPVSYICVVISVKCFFFQQPVKVEKQQQPLRHLPPTVVQLMFQDLYNLKLLQHLLYHVQCQLSAETFKIFNKIRQQFQERSFYFDNCFNFSTR